MQGFSSVVTSVTRLPRMTGACSVCTVANMQCKEYFLQYMLLSLFCQAFKRKNEKKMKVNIKKILFEKKKVVKMKHISVDFKNAKV